MNYFLCDNDIVKYKKKRKSPRKSSNNNTIHLYEEAEILKKKKEQRINQERKLEEEIMKETHTFRPDISKSNREEKNKLKKSNKEESFYVRQERWKKTLASRNEKIKEYFLSLEMEDCTFKPKIEPRKLKDDEEFIQKNLSQIMQYVNHRQGVINKYNSQKNYENKKFFNKSRNYTIKPTICKEFDLKTSKLNRSFSTITSKYKLSNKVMRSKINMEDFFSEKLVKERSLSINEFPVQKIEEQLEKAIDVLSGQLEK